MRKRQIISLCGLALQFVNWLLFHNKFVTLAEYAIITIAIIAAVILIKVRGKMYNRNHRSRGGIF
jgi:integral membrane sensor domain MASE1